MIRATLLTAATLTITSCAAPPPDPLSYLPPPNNAPTLERPVIDEEPWTLIADSGRRITTPSWRLYTTAPPLSAIDDRLPALLEAALSEYTSRDADLPMPSEPLDVYVLRSRTQWAALTQRLTPEHADRLLRIQRGGYTLDRKSVLFDIGARDTLALAVHEGWHLYTQSTFRDPLPLWLEEGLAVSMEGARTDAVRGRPVLNAWANVERFDQLRAAAATGALLSLTELLQSSPARLVQAHASTDTALTWYAQTWALVQLLREHDAARYRPALRRLLNDAQSGRLRQRLGGRTLARVTSGPAVFASYFGDPAVLETEYRAFIERMTGVGAKDAIVAGRSPLTR